MMHAGIKDFVRGDSKDFVCQAKTVNFERKDFCAESAVAACRPRRSKFPQPQQIRHNRSIFHSTSTYKNLFK
jgi:hypothetical protein